MRTAAKANEDDFHRDEEFVDFHRNDFHHIDLCRGVFDDFHHVDVFDDFHHDDVLDME